MSETIDEGGPAFPVSIHPGHGYGPVASVEQGMTLRDYFAAKAINAILAFQYHGSEINTCITVDQIAKSAYAIADAMLKAREQ